MGILFKMLVALKLCELVLDELTETESNPCHKKGMYEVSV